VRPLTKRENHRVVLSREAERTLTHLELKPLLRTRGERLAGTVPQLMRRVSLERDVRRLSDQVPRVVATDRTRTKIDRARRSVQRIRVRVHLVRTDKDLPRIRLDVLHDLRVVASVRQRVPPLSV